MGFLVCLSKMSWEEERLKSSFFPLHSFSTPRKSLLAPRPLDAAPTPRSPRPRRSRVFPGSCVADHRSGGHASSSSCAALCNSEIHEQWRHLRRVKTATDCVPGLPHSSVTVGGIPLLLLSPEASTLWGPCYLHEARSPICSRAPRHILSCASCARHVPLENGAGCATQSGRPVAQHQSLEKNRPS